MLSLLVSLVLMADPESPGAAAVPTAEQQRHFETRVRPLLAEHCWNCHGEKKQWGALRLDSRDALLRGGDTGPAITLDRPDESLLLRAVRHEDENLKMPRDGKLTAAQIADLQRWIRDGAFFPAKAARPTHNRQAPHWAFQPPAVVTPPAVRNRAWPQTEIDQFILARLEGQQLAPTQPAARRQLLRRLTFDLTGLPPRPEQLDEFLADSSPDAVARLVDRILAAPTYGERWGRHWLDVARYADSNGLDENIAHGNAWRYRDYVVAAWNRDKPFDQFLVEQLAGDLLPSASEPQRHEQLIATGFISIGPKVLAEVNEAKMRMDIVDEQVDAVGRVFLGMTLGCARCHDHKFDPIDTADYYGLAGVFKSTRTMDTYTKVAKWHENLLPSAAADAIRAAFDTDVTTKKKAIDAFVAQANQQVREKLKPDEKPPENLETLYSDEMKAALKKLRDELAAFEKEGPDLPAAMGVTDDTIVNLPIHVRGNPLKLGEVVPRRTPPALRGAVAPSFAADQSGRRQLADWLVDPRHPLTSRVFVNRVWRWHFGKGLVRTTDNFGLLGETPSHPELLDWLASRFISTGWSIKSLHRELLLSSTFQQSDVALDDTRQRDPDNRWLSRFAARRLEAEELRDAVLMVSGDLDRTMGGTLLKVKNRGYLFDHTSIDKTDYRSNRRSLYLPVIRNNVYDVFQLLDFPDPAVPTGDRATTTVAPQALLMMNSDLVLQAAHNLAQRVIAVSPDRGERLNEMYRLALSRSPTAAELAADTQFLADIERLSATDGERQAWTALGQVLLAASEFCYVR